MNDPNDWNQIEDTISPGINKSMQYGYTRPPVHHRNSVDFNTEIKDTSKGDRSGGYTTKNNFIGQDYTNNVYRPKSAQKMDIINKMRRPTRILNGTNIINSQHMTSINSVKSSNQNSGMLKKIDFLPKTSPNYFGGKMSVANSSFEDFNS
jgi:hypothetical protein